MAVTRAAARVRAATGRLVLHAGTGARRAVRCSPSLVAAPARGGAVVATRAKPTRAEDWPHGTPALSCRGATQCQAPSGAQSSAPENLELTTQSEHIRDHMRSKGVVRNQYGTWPLREVV